MNIPKGASLAGFIFFFIAHISFGQEKSGPSFMIGTKASYINNTWRGTYNESFGMYGEGNFPLLRKSDLNARLQFGVDKTMGCDANCRSMWFLAPVWGGVGFQKDLLVLERHLFYAGIGAKHYFGANNLETNELEDPSRLISGRILMLNLTVGYYLPGNLPFVVKYSFDGEQFYRINSLSLAWRFE
ncbi:hypothetical protein KIH41_09720 [Litoribacter ruber]|uniref:hypothetical protein n=1 Tax=Litoribacter ruber TaxID=702568 RepID=UPI001BDB696B|nr:hypothetical protein [Litoribacter ruber]MBT0811554.1 hypothetical protein [Litoribacter ruber]